jgi:FlaA1/EpsC-like NDP-sugar epimerase
MKLYGRLRSPLVAFVHDLLMVPLAWLAAYWLRFNFSAIPAEYLTQAWLSLPLLVMTQAGAFVYFGLYRGDWRFASMPDLMRIIKAVSAGTLICLATIFLLTRLHTIPRSVFPAYWLLLIVALGTPRFFYRWLKDRKLYLGNGKRVLIVGAGRAGEMLARDLLRDPERTLQPVGFIDDKRRKLGAEIHGIRVLGRCSQIPELTDKLEIDLILIAIPSAGSRELRRIVEYCEASNTPFRAIPCMQDLVAGRVSIDTLRELSIEDLLGRDPVTLDQRAISAELSGRCVLISGAGGSIGTELCRQVAKLTPARLVLLENCEFNLFRIDNELRQSFPHLDIQARLCDVADTVAVEKLFERYHPDIVYHAAAYKHVPMLESQMREAVQNNVCGTRVMSLAADRYACDAFVLISTDKAVNPANIMGASKRIAEIFCQNFNPHSSTRFITVRFGNVLGSNGSVVPLFKAQIEAGGPVTVTHPEMTRYFMTIPEAGQLILQAASMGGGGEIYVLDMGEPVRITYLAEQMIRLSGNEPGKDIEIVYTGLRPGEKLFEELFHETEQLAGTQHEKIFLANHRTIEWELLDRTIRSLDAACKAYDEKALLKGIATLVPELHHTDKTLPDNVIPLANQRKQGDATINMAT